MRHDRESELHKEAERQWLKVFRALDEGAARLLAAQRALEQGRGGISRVAEVTGMSRNTVAKGMVDLRDAKTLRRIERGRSRRTGGGRKLVEAVKPGVKRALAGLLEETTAGDPMCALRWTLKSSRNLADELRRLRFRVSHVTVARLVGELGYSLQGNFRAIEGEEHVGRDDQFHLINSTVKSYLQSGEPVISVDAKKRELVGRFKNAGRELRPRGRPDRVNTYDYRSLAEGIAIPYGALDVRTNEALVNVGVSSDTSEFAVESLRRWWRLLGRAAYPKATRLLICADGGGSNSSSRRTWKLYLQELADEMQMAIRVCHYPPGTSKWNKIEHRLFSFISLNWRGKPLTDYQTVVNLIGHTKTRTGLTVKAVLDTAQYQKGQEVTDEQLRQVHLETHGEYPKWNYTITPNVPRTQKA